MSPELAYHRLRGEKGTYELVKGPWEQWIVYLDGCPCEFPFPSHAVAMAFVEMFEGVDNVAT